MKKIKNFFNSGWPILFILFVCFWLFRPFFLKGLLPIPSDIIVGVYYPWLDYKWGFPAGVPVKNPLLSDIPSLIYPWRSFAVDQLKSFRWPLWNPYYFAGMPLLANFQSAVFSYVNLLFLFLPKAFSWSGGVFLSLLLCLILVYFFLRGKKLSKIACLFGAVTFSLGGFQIAWMEYNVLGQTALFLPLLLLAVDNIFGKKSLFWLFLLPVLLAMQIFSGYVPIVIYSYIICFFYVLFFYFFPQAKNKKINWKTFCSLIFFWIFGLALAAVQLLPGWELARNSIRSIDPIVVDSQASYLPGKNLLTLLAPDFFGNPATGNYFGGAYYDNFYFFAGTIALIFILLSAWFIKKDKNIFFWWIILAFSLLLAFNNPLGRFIERLFYLSGGVASRALFMTDFALAMLAAWGMENFRQSHQRHRVILSVSLIFLFFIFAYWQSAKIVPGSNRLVAQKNLIIPGGVLLVAAFILGVGELAGKRLRSLIAIILLFLSTAQLLYSAQKYLPFSPKELLFPKTPIIEFLLKQKEKSQDPFRTEINDVIPQNMLMPYGLETTSGYDTLLPRRMGEFLWLLGAGKISEKISRVQLIDNYRSWLFPLLNTKYVLAKKMSSQEISSRRELPSSVFQNKRFRLVFEDRTVQVYEDTQFLPRAFWIHDYVVANQEYFKTFLPNKFDFSQKVILEKPIEFVPPLVPAKANLVRWKEYLPGKLILEVESDQPGLIFLSQNFFPGWQVFVDDRKTEIYRANYTFQAILVGEGRHLLTLQYQPKTFLYGGLVSIFALANWLLFSIIFILRYLWGKKP